MGATRAIANKTDEGFRSTGQLRFALGAEDKR
jgi:hypothetical protein